MRRSVTVPREGLLTWRGVEYAPAYSGLFRPSGPAPLDGPEFDHVEPMAWYTPGLEPVAWAKYAADITNLRLPSADKRVVHRGQFFARYELVLRAGVAFAERGNEEFGPAFVMSGEEVLAVVMPSKDTRPGYLIRADGSLLCESLASIRASVGMGSPQQRRGAVLALHIAREREYLRWVLDAFRRAYGAGGADGCLPECGSRATREFEPERCTCGVQDALAEPHDFAAGALAGMVPGG